MLTPEQRNFDFSALLEHPACSALRLAAAGTPCHLVGGALRDTALGLAPRDLDAVLAGDGPSVATRLAARQGSRLVDLGGERFAAFRVIADDYTIDLWDRGRTSLEKDLRRRDLTIHSFALDLTSGEICDPHGGLRDLATRCLRATTDESFSDDPLRVLRLCRFSCLLADWEIEGRTEGLAAEAVRHLTEVAAERRRSELELIFRAPYSHRSADLLVRLRLYPSLWAESLGDGDAKGPPAPELAKAMRSLSETVSGLEEPVDLYIANMALLFAGLSVIDPNAPRKALASFQATGLITRRNAQQVSCLLAWDALPRTEEEQRWFLYRQGSLWPSAVSFLAARATFSGGQPSTAAAHAIADLARRIPHEVFDPPPLVSGSVLQKALGLAPGPDLGRILDLILRRQVEGSIVTREQALRLAHELTAQIAGEE